MQFATLHYVRKLNMTFKPSLIFSFLAALPLSAVHADDSKTLPQIVVTATRSPVPLSQVASSMTVITRKDIEQQNRSDVTDLLRQVPGVIVASNGAAGQTARVFMRGTNSNHVLVMMDGVALNDPSDPGNAFDFANINTDNIEQIEVLRGPQSTLYGSQALGGVINIITKKGAGKPRSTAFAEYGTYNSRKLGASNSGEVGNTSYSLSVSESFSSGISALSEHRGGNERDDIGSQTVSLNVSSQLTDNFTAKLDTRLNRNEAEFDSLGGFTRPADDAFPNNDSRQFNGRAAGELSLFDGQWIQEVSISELNVNRNLITEYFDAAFTAFFGRQQFFGRRETIDWVHRIRPAEGHLVTLGTEAWKEQFKTNTQRANDVSNQAFFADYQFNLGSQFFMHTGARADNHQTFGQQFTWKVAPGYLIESTNTRLKVSYGTGFKAPSLSQLFDPSSGNPNLQPETSRGWDAGFEQSLMDSKLTFGSTVFRNYIRQLISFTTTPPFVGINIGKARTEGVESTFSYRPSSEWELKASHVYTLAEDRVNDRDLLRRPKHQFNSGVVYYLNPDMDMGVNVRYFSDRRDFDINPPYSYLDVKSFAAVDLSANYRINPNLAVYGRLDNLLDKRYEEVYSYGMPGRSFFAGIKTSF